MAITVYTKKELDKIALDAVRDFEFTESVTRVKFTHWTLAVKHLIVTLQAHYTCFNRRVVPLKFVNKVGGNKQNRLGEENQLMRSHINVTLI